MYYWLTAEKLIIKLGAGLVPMLSNGYVNPWHKQAPINLRMPRDQGFVGLMDPFNSYPIPTPFYKFSMNDFYM